MKFLVSHIIYAYLRLKPTRETWILRRARTWLNILKARACVQSVTQRWMYAYVVRCRVWLLNISYYMKAYKLPAEVERMLSRARSLTALPPWSFWGYRIVGKHANNSCDSRFQETCNFIVFIRF